MRDLQLGKFGVGYRIHPAACKPQAPEARNTAETHTQFAKVNTVSHTNNVTIDSKNTHK